MNKAVISSCNLNQWALDFDGNLKRVIQSIIDSKIKKSRLRIGPELELSGYSCEDHFLELDTYIHCYESLAEILESDVTNDIICDIGCPILFNDIRYNCRVICLNRKIIYIRPKTDLADDGNYREKRYFSSWSRDQNVMKEWIVPDVIKKVTNQSKVPFGLGILRALDCTIACEICEELWSPNPHHIYYSLLGVNIITNSSGSHHQLRKLSNRLDLITQSMKKLGGVYMYSNQRGCDGNRLYFDGCSLICLNGDVISQASQFSLVDVEVITATVDLSSVTNYRQSSASYQGHGSAIINHNYTFIDIDFSLCLDPINKYDLQKYPLTSPVNLRLHSPEEECAFGPACWLWDYLRRSGASGYLLPLSGGADSSSVASIVKVMCDMAIKEAVDGNEQVISDITSIANRSNNGTVENISDSKTLCSYILHTVYLGSENSSNATRRRSSDLASAIGSYHSYLPIDSIISAILTVFTTYLSPNRPPKFSCHGGSITEDLALQNIQARIRMVLAYLCAQLLPWVRGRKGFLLVLGSANVDEALRGYMTKYDCSSADINPIGGICKSDLKRMLNWAADKYNLPIIKEIAGAPPTAELRPISDGETNDYTQTDEEDMGMTYDELGIFGLYRKVYRCGPVSMFIKLLDLWKSHVVPKEIAVKVKRFFYYYGINRHKLTTLTPSYHAENYSPDDNRFDLRQFLYNNTWSRQFQRIDEILKFFDVENIDENIEKKLSNISNKVTDVETLLAVVEAKLNSIPDLDTSNISNSTSSNSTNIVSNNDQSSNKTQSSGSTPNPPPPPSATNPNVNNSNQTNDIAPPPAAPVEDPALAGKVKASEHPDYLPFFKLLKVGVPPPVIANKIAAAGLDSSLIDQPDKYIDL